MIEIFSREFIYLWYFFSIQFEQIFGFYVLGIIIGSIISVFGKERIHQLFSSMQNKKFGAFGVIPASILGISSPLCMYGTIPIAAAFSEKGMKDDWLAAFMMSSILLNPQLIIYSAALGTTGLAVRIVSCFLCGIVAGLCIRLWYTNRSKTFFRFSAFEEPENRDTDPNLLWRLLKNIWRNVKVTGPYFLLGVAISAAFVRYVPENIIIGLFGGNKAFGTLMAASIAVPLYVCGGGTIPLIQWWMASGMSMGSAAAFMLTGPATKITNLGAIKIVLGFKRFALYMCFVLLFAFVTGLVTDFLVWQ